jgi:hypothetical protein
MLRRVSTGKGIKSIFLCACVTPTLHCEETELIQRGPPRKTQKDLLKSAFVTRLFYCKQPNWWGVPVKQETIKILLQCARITRMLHRKSPNYLKIGLLDQAKCAGPAGRKNRRVLGSIDANYL